MEILINPFISFRLFHLLKVTLELSSTEIFITYNIIWDIIRHSNLRSIEQCWTYMNAGHISRSPPLKRKWYAIYPKKIHLTIIIVYSAPYRSGSDPVQPSWVGAECGKNEWIKTKLTVSADSMGTFGVLLYSTGNSSYREGTEIWKYFFVRKVNPISTVGGPNAMVCRIGQLAWYQRTPLTQSLDYLLYALPMWDFEPEFNRRLWTLRKNTAPSPASRRGEVSIG